ncbi:MAG: urease accessory protein [Solirubrobacteraceae bacterium]|nr:urease accessory protein [Solirubrobacteraceae bacterium]
MPPFTRTPTLPIAAAEPPGVSLAIGAELRAGRTIVEVLAGTEPWRPRILAPDRAIARVALVQSRASLLSGDDVRVRIEVGPEAALELVELGATIANHVRGGAGALVDVRVFLAAGARLVWLAEPLIASAGCALEQTTSIALETGARALVGEAVVLGRHGEQPGGVRSRTRITLEGRPVVDETFATDPAWLLRSTVVAGESRMIEALTLAGMRDGDPSTGAYQAHEPATLWRSLGPAHAGAPGASELAERWRALALYSSDGC